MKKFMEKAGIEQTEERTKHSREKILKAGRAHMMEIIPEMAEGGGETIGRHHGILLQKGNEQAPGGHTGAGGRQVGLRGSWGKSFT